jgi:hypothetical protein
MPIKKSNFFIRNILHLLKIRSMNRNGNRGFLSIISISIFLFLSTITYQQYDILSDADFLCPGFYFQNQDIDNQPVHKKFLTIASCTSYLQQSPWTDPDELIISGALSCRSLIENKSNLRC